MKKFGLESVARACARHPKRTLAAWAVVLMLSGVMTALFLGGSLTSEDHFTSNPESARADALISERLPATDKQQELIIVRSETLTVDSAAFREQVAGVSSRVMALGTDVVESAVDYTTVPLPSLISTDKHATVVVFTMAGDLQTADKNVDDLVAAAKGPGNAPGFTLLATGEPSINRDFSATAEKDLRTGEIFGAGIALVILVLVFGAVVTAAVPLVLAVAAIVLALGITTLVGRVMDLSFFITNMITMIGLAMGIDYSLFVVSRYREERQAGRDKIDAIGRAGSTAMRSVLFSAMAVILALAGLFLVPSTLFHSMAMGAIIAVFTALLAALTLLPALLGLLGDRVNALRIPFLRGARGGAGRPGGFWDRLSRGVMRRPVFSLLAAVAVLALAASLYFSISLGSAGVATLPPASESRQGFELLMKEFTAGEELSPVQIVIDGQADSSSVTEGTKRLETILAGDKMFQGPARSQVSPAGDLTVLTFGIAVDASSKAAQQAVRQLRSEYIPEAFSGDGASAAGVSAAVTAEDVYVTGQTAGTIDYLDSINRATPWVFLFILGLSFVLLALVFRSLVVPLKAILMNLLSVGAAYGLMVAVFQKGWGAGLLGLQHVEFIEAWVPLFLFAVLFGTSMDYHVFLLSRVREHFDETGDNRESVAFGLRRTGGIITGAALIMVAVFGGFASGQLVMFQQLGFGLAVAVLLDATIVRSILVPAAMRLLGAANWWFPHRLRWLPDMRVEPVAGSPAEGMAAEGALAAALPRE
jgi:RND superfamily putative drug exporter